VGMRRPPLLLLTPLAAGLVLALGLAVVACGGGSSAGAALGEAAELAPASAKAFVVLRTDGDAEQTRAAIELLERFPAVRDADLDLRDDILPALGDEVALVALEGGTMVGLARPDDRAKLDALLARTDDPPVTRELEGWTAFSDNEAALDAFDRARAAGTLADDERFREEFDSLPSDALAKAWSTEQGDSLPGIRAAVFAEDDGLRFEGSVAGGPAGTEAEVFEPRLLERVPAGSSLVASFRGPEDLASKLGQLPIPPALGLDGLLGLLEGEGVLYLRQAALIPEVTLLTEVEDEAAATASVRRLVEGLGAPVQPGEGGGGSVELGPVTLSYGARDGVLAVTTAGLAALDAAADPITGDPRFTQAAERAQMPDESAGFLYVRLDDLVPLATMLAGTAGAELPQEVRANLQPLRTLFLWGGRDGDRTTFAGTLELSR
jgi:hypothetical protein